ncbi:MULTISPECIES: hypothetical protein [Mumia]|uniref:hypothetical protein n=1 Tax=Mumia TaxID=1546255 RepID=UPI001424A046|nr:hypothetical protein [Mumia sp. ZJ430]
MRPRLAYAHGGVTIRAAELERLAQLRPGELGTDAAALRFGVASVNTTGAVSVAALEATP